MRRRSHTLCRISTKKLKTHHIRTHVKYNICNLNLYSYLYNKTTKETAWLDEEVVDEEESVVTIEEQGETKQCNKKRQSFRKIVDDNKAVFFQNVETGETVWSRPVDSELVL